MSLSDILFPSGLVYLGYQSSKLLNSRSPPNPSLVAAGRQYRSGLCEAVQF